jgi:hypothetical protein
MSEQNKMKLQFMPLPERIRTSKNKYRDLALEFVASGQQTAKVDFSNFENPPKASGVYACLLKVSKELTGFKVVVYNKKDVFLVKDSTGKL